MAIDRFYLPNLEPLALEGAEARHCAIVLRHKAGDRVTVFDGRGTEVMAEITATAKERVELREMSRTRTAPLPYQITLGQAIPKGSRMDTILEKAVELGAAHIAPLVSERTVVRVDEERAEAKLEKWRQAVVEAAKQCGQNHLPDVAPPQPARAFLDQPPACDLLLVASLQPGAVSFRAVFSDFEREKGRRPRSAAVLIGPEGDFTPAELARARASGFRPVTLGAVILRTDTASLFALSVLGYEFQQGDAPPGV